MTIKEAVLQAKGLGKCLPAFNIPHIPMLKPIAQAIKDENSVAMIQVARVEWEKFNSESLERVAEEYAKYVKPGHTFLHLDHVPVIDEDNVRVDYMALIYRALAAGFESVMVDGSRLSLEENIAATAEVAAAAHAKGVPVEAELGAVMGHESGEMPPYDVIFATKQGFTKLDEAKKFADESACDWLSVAVGNIHGRIAEAVRDQKKPEAKIDVAHVKALSETTNIPLVLHGGSGINHEFVLQAFASGIAKINVGTEMRQVYEFALREKDGDIEYAREKLYLRCRDYIKNYMYNSDIADKIK